MNKTKIEWTDYTWNPIKGLCPVDCKTPDGKSYCYARAIYTRFKIMEQPEYQGSDLFLKSREETTAPMRLKKPSKIFVCSTCEIFHPDIPKSWRDDIFDIIAENPKHTFQILTKMPENIDRPIPDNVWLGVSVTNQIDALERIPKILQIRAKTRFASIEPMLEAVYLCADYHDYLVGWDVDFDHDPGCDGSCDYCPVAVQYKTNKLDWVIVGKLTGHGKKHDPERDWLEWILFSCGENRVPIFMKNNLKDIWGGNLIQELPE